jgi:hypothetical protein
MARLSTISSNFLRQLVNLRRELVE